MKRLSELTGQPEVGKYYRVPCVHVVFPETEKGYWLPVLGPLHADPELVRDPAQRQRRHYHHDLRFFTRELFRRFYPGMGDITTWEEHDWVRAISTVIAEPLPDVRPFWRTDGCTAYTPDPLGTGEHLVERPLRCARPHRFFPEVVLNRFTGLTYRPLPPRRLEPVYIGVKTDPKKPVCPHKGYPLHQLTPDAKGNVVCPLHGLCIHLATGEVVSRLTEVPCKS